MTALINWLVVFAMIGLFMVATFGLITHMITGDYEEDEDE